MERLSAPNDDVAREIARVGGDRLSGATALMRRGLEILRPLAGDPDVLRDAVVALCHAQPSMAGFRTAAAVLLASAEPAAAIEALDARVRHAPARIARAAVPLLRLRRQTDGAMRIVTLSRSAAVERTVLELAEREPVTLCCAEGRPACEGLGLARELAEQGMAVELYTDAGLGAALPGAHALVVGADALANGGFVNKVGTAALCALARASGVGVVVLASREKILPTCVFSALPLRHGPADELPASHAAVRVRNPYFERVPAALVTEVVTDTAVLEAHDIEAARLWSDGALQLYLSIVGAGNMLDTD